MTDPKLAGAIATLAAAQGAAIDAQRAEAAAVALTGPYATLARQTPPKFEHEPASYLAALARAR